MVDPGRIISYLALSVIALFGIAVVSGLFAGFEPKMRIAVGVVIALYLTIRIVLMRRKARPRSMLRGYESNGKNHKE